MRLIPENNGGLPVNCGSLSVVRQLFEETMARKPKYRNVKVEFNGIKFDSKKELKRYRELLLLERAGEIKGLELQKVFPFVVNGDLICKYKCDFYYLEQDGAWVVEDVKSPITARTKITASRTSFLPRSMDTRSGRFEGMTRGNYWKEFYREQVTGSRNEEGRMAKSSGEKQTDIGREKRGG